MQKKVERSIKSKQKGSAWFIQKVRQIWEHSHAPSSISPTGPYCLMETENFFLAKY